MKAPAHLLLPALAAVVLLATTPLANAYSGNCKFNEPRTLKLDLSGIRTVLFDVHSNNIKLKGATGGEYILTGKACASNQDLLSDLSLTQKRVGDKLIVSLGEKHLGHLSLGNGSYLDLSGNIPSNILVELKVSSGDAWLSGVKAASADLGSGNVDLRDIPGMVTATVGSGDLKVGDIGTLKVLALASGDIVANAIAQKAEIGSVASGELTLKQVGAGVELNSVSSGEAKLDAVTGDIVVGSIGSGELYVRDVRGNLIVRRLGSGDIHHHGVTGSVNIPKQD